METVERAKFANLADIERRMKVKREPQNIEYRTAEPQKCKSGEEQLLLRRLNRPKAIILR